MYKTPIMHGTTIDVSDKKTEGETIEDKVIRLIQNKEPIKDGIPIIFTDRKDGVNAAYNIRTDRWEIAVDAMEKIDKIKAAKRDEIVKPKDDKKDDKKDVGEAKSVPGKTT
ncbi:MAG: hypothetical protein [Microviridae sp.]|nr:MAG: hypothetical protein [Microviridae sp.]